MVALGVATGTALEVLTYFASVHASWKNQTIWYSSTPRSRGRKTFLSIISRQRHMLSTIAAAAAFGCAQLAKSIAFGDSSSGGSTFGWAGDNQWAYNKLKINGNAVTVTGSGRYILVHDFKQRSWGAHRYVRFDLRSKTLQFYVDLSGVQCRCAGTLYFSYMPDGAGNKDNYCGISTGTSYDGGPCTEVDIMEANSKGFHSALHTKLGESADGTCNFKGCTTNIGVAKRTPSGELTSDLYGKAEGARINTRRPFAVSVAFDQDGVWSTTLRQDDRHVRHFNASSASNPNANRSMSPTGVPISARRRLNQSNSQCGEWDRIHSLALECERCCR